VPFAERLSRLGFQIYATLGTSTALRDRGIRSHAVFRISKGRPNVLDMIEEKNVAWIVNTPSSGRAPMMDEVRMRASAVIRGIPITTTIDGLRAAVDGLEALRQMQGMTVCSLQEFHRHCPRLALPGGRRPAGGRQA
jgi:carbamoyl-phosphate synthase large subunit